MQEQYRVTYLRANGSVWLQKFDTLFEVAEQLEFLVGNYPHIIISKQTFKLEKVPESDDKGNIDESWE